VLAPLVPHFALKVLNAYAAAADHSAMNLTNMYSVIMPQSWSQKQSVTSAKYLAKVFDPYSFYGGRKALNQSGAFTDATDYVNKYVWKYRSTYYPQAPIELVPDSTLALETSLATLDLKNNERPLFLFFIRT